jgi:ribosome biogenesis GTPase
MGKSKLTQQQRKRIKDRQSRLSTTSKANKPPETLLSPDQLGAEQIGTVVTRFSNQADVIADESINKTVRRCYFRSNLDSLVTGDHVVWQNGDPYGVISAVQPRTSQLDRLDSRGQANTIVANVDNVMLVVAPEPQPHAGLIDRYLVAIEHHQISAAIVVNKIDLSTEQLAPVLELIQRYQEIGYQVNLVSSKSGEGMGKLAERLSDQTSVFVGQSGVGKSSIINVLCPLAAAKTGKLSNARAKGRHTTTTADLYRLPGGGSIVDSPGIREFGLGHLETDQLLDGFVEFRPYVGKCRFRNCKHLNEPDCALKVACAEGKISGERLSSFRNISESMAS